MFARGTTARRPRCSMSARPHNLPKFFSTPSATDSRHVVIPTRERSETGGICCQPGNRHNPRGDNRPRQSGGLVSSGRSSNTTTARGNTHCEPTPVKGCHSDARAQRDRRNLLFAAPLPPHLPRTTPQASLHFSNFDRFPLLPGNNFKDFTFLITRTGNRYQTFSGAAYPASASISLLV